MCGPRQLIFQCGTEKPKSWTPLVKSMTLILHCLINRTINFLLKSQLWADVKLSYRCVTKADSRNLRNLSRFTHLQSSNLPPVLLSGYITDFER